MKESDINCNCHVFFNCQELKIGYSSVRRDDIPLHFSLSFFDPSPLEEEEEEEEEEGPSLEKGGEEGKKGKEAKSGVDGSPFAAAITGRPYASAILY